MTLRHTPAPIPSPKVPGEDFDDYSMKVDTGEYPAFRRDVRHGNRWSRTIAAIAGVAGVGVSAGGYSLGISAIEDRAQVVVDAGVAAHEHRITVLETGQVRLEQKVDRLDDKMDRVLDVLDTRLPPKKSKTDGGH